MDLAELILNGLNYRSVELFSAVQASSSHQSSTVLVNRLKDWACPVNVWLDKLTGLNMTPMGWLGHKTNTNKQLKQV